MPVCGEVETFEQCSAVYEVLVTNHRDRALIYLMDKFGADLVNQWLSWRWAEARTVHLVSVLRR